MPRRAHSPTNTRRLVPTSAILFITGSRIAKQSPRHITVDKVGQKTFGLASIPAEWTPPFFAVSSELFSDYASNRNGRKKLLLSWAKRITDASMMLAIAPADEVLVRSSGRNEGITGRGKFYSTSGKLKDIRRVLAKCLQRLARDKDLKRESIPLLIQKKCNPEKAIGHLSNERRCYEESRDWMGEMKVAESDNSSYFQINLRRWRENIPQSSFAALSCSLSTHISEVLKVPANWAYEKSARVHFEWVWDGMSVYIVQADEEVLAEGHNPVEEHASRQYRAISLEPRCLRRVDEHAARRFSKISNVFTYLQLRLPIAPLYILDDQHLIHQLSKGEVPPNLQAELTELVKGSLVIRTDIVTENLKEKQLLPRTEELKNSSAAIEWLIKNSKQLVQLGKEGAFIFHNFIPAQAAAFAYADPKHPLVQIESLWGLPEGLYYNSHDKYMVDTLKADINTVSRDKLGTLPMREKRNFKRFFVSTTESGKWETLVLRQPYDWKGSLSEEDCRTIAFESRRIATAVGYGVSIMWFVGVPKSVAESPAIPWYHEKIDITASRPSLTTRTKTQFDKCYVIQSEDDVAKLKTSMENAKGLSRIRIQPLDENLLREKSTLKKIGELAKEKGATIVLEGAVLSHAFYQLLDTGAVVEVVHPFIGFEERQGYNKLVRDLVPELIRQRGEIITTAKLASESLIRALKEKLVEEAYELLDAKDLQALTAEITDIREVLDTLLKKLNVSEEAIAREQAQKRKERGGFDEGIVLVETENSPPAAQAPAKPGAALLNLNDNIGSMKVIDEAEFRRRSEHLEKRTDRRVGAGKVEIKATVTVPVIRTSAWTVETAGEQTDDPKPKIISGHLKGVRRGANWSFEVSVEVDEGEPGLL